MKAVGAELVVIGNGTPNFVAGFREETKFDGPIYCDPSRRSYDLMGMHRNAWRMLNPVAAAKWVGAMFRGHKQSGPQGDAWQLGGVAVVLRGGKVAYLQISKYGGDHAPAGEIIAALEQAVKTAA